MGGCREDRKSEDDVRASKGWRCADFFSGIGGFHIAASNLGHEVVFACDIDRDVRRAYRHNFGLVPWGDIVELRPNDVPDHDLLMAGFPCQPFSIIGQRRGFADPRGSLFFELLRFSLMRSGRGLLFWRTRSSFRRLLAGA